MRVDGEKIKVLSCINDAYEETYIEILDRHTNQSTRLNCLH